MCKRVFLVIMLSVFWASAAGAFTNGSMELQWTKTTDATIRYELRWKHFANGWAWAPIAGNLDSTTGRHVFTFPPLADSTGDRGFCVDARAVKGTKASAWLSETGKQVCNKMPTTGVIVPTPMPIPTPVPPSAEKCMTVANATTQEIIIRLDECVK